MGPLATGSDWKWDVLSSWSHSISLFDCQVKFFRGSIERWIDEGLFHHGAPQKPVDHHLHITLYYDCDVGKLGLILPTGQNHVDMVKDHRWFDMFIHSRMENPPGREKIRYKWCIYQQAMLAADPLSGFYPFSHRVLEGLPQDDGNWSPYLAPYFALLDIFEPSRNLRMVDWIWFQMNCKV